MRARITSRETTKMVARYNWAKQAWVDPRSAYRVLGPCRGCGLPLLSRPKHNRCEECRRREQAAQREAHRQILISAGVKFLGKGGGTRNPPPQTYQEAQRRAISAVNNAKNCDKLPRLTGLIPCVDCGHPAKVYDHRDYSKPLDVEPVCHSCNSQRGPAMWAVPGSAA